MKRNLVLIRHAKSSWSNPLQSDYERPLNERGNKEAPMMGERLKSRGILPDKIVASTAKRAAQTAEKIAAALGYPSDKIDWQEKLYHCIPSVFEEVIYELDDAIGTVFIVAHNPGITEFASELSAKFNLDNMPPCGVVAMEMEADHWSDFNSVSHKVFLSDAPKNDFSF